MNTYDEFKSQIIQIIDQRHAIWCDEQLSLDEFKTKDNKLEKEQWDLFKQYPEWYDQWYHECLEKYISTFDN